MYVLLEIASQLRSAHGTQLFHRGFQQLRDVLLDLLADAGFLQSCEKFLILNMGKSAAQRTFHDVVVNHGSPSSLEIGHGKGRSSRLGAAGPI